MLSDHGALMAQWHPSTLLPASDHTAANVYCLQYLSACCALRCQSDCSVMYMLLARTTPCIGVLCLQSSNSAPLTCRSSPSARFPACPLVVAPSCTPAPAQWATLTWRQTCCNDACTVWHALCSTHGLQGHVRYLCVYLPFEHNMHAISTCSICLH